MADDAVSKSRRQPQPASRPASQSELDARISGARAFLKNQVLAIATFAVFWLLGSGQCLAQNAYITNEFSNTVSVIDTASNTVIATISAGGEPGGVAVSPDGRKVYLITHDPQLT
jgi:YVTN family beta-propeller protein